MKGSNDSWRENRLYIHFYWLAIFAQSKSNSIPASEEGSQNFKKYWGKKHNFSHPVYDIVMWNYISGLDGHKDNATQTQTLETVSLFNRKCVLLFKRERESDRNVDNQILNLIKQL